MPTRVLVPSGVLGLGFDRQALKRGVANRPDIICIDGGSTDSGPFSLGAGVSKYSRAATRSEWRDLMRARAEAGVPLVIGTAGTCGTDATVDWMHDITVELAAELGQTLKIARLYSSQPAERIITALEAGRIRPLEPAPAISPEVLSGLANIVALAGAEQIQAALATGADIVIAGRTTDTATIAALPLLRGDHAGGAWHGAKIAECGALCSTHPTSGVIQVDFDADGFTVEPLAETAACTPHSVSAHMLYENSDPYQLYEPGGYLDVRGARYTALDERRVRVEGSRWVKGAYTVKLEGARVAGYQTTILAILRNERYVKGARAWIERLSAFLEGEIRSRMGLEPGEAYTLEFRLIGVDAALGELERRQGDPVEVGVLGIVTATSQMQAAEIGKLINPFVLHYPLTDHEELPTFAFPYSPAQSDRGALYEFALNHVMDLDDPMSAFRLVVTEVAHGPAR
ncbi:acyclic terpene utilization AtuA family protein [Microvirga tunisiensis]|uniref:Acyclic terpene utilization AtuA family protein n=1 Tax=Pannonibacter tanglangensis TaxID=2750084 RepID=A0A7X5F0Q7_9HYPH|nr:acyclic terpene utilization AtuA family protein [Pannonibacter sp. XCT-53]NBN77636.1 acyclic terpene utilization AtuA family protein [Pannonibacter sp. XCT-53]